MSMHLATLAKSGLTIPTVLPSALSDFFAVSRICLLGCCSQHYIMCSQLNLWQKPPRPLTRAPSIPGTVALLVLGVLNPSGNRRATRADDAATPLAHP